MLLLFLSLMEDTMGQDELGMLVLLILLWFICGGPESANDVAEDVAERIHVW